MSVEIDALYKNARAVLWVEDPETRAWLEALWLGQAPTIRIMVAGGHPNVAAVCQQALDYGVTNVFGLVDQDFGTSNRNRWLEHQPPLVFQPNERIYRLDVHEFENLLLVPDALSGCRLNLDTGKRTSPEIEIRIFQAAEQLAWWVACARFLADTKLASSRDFPSNPRLSTVQSLAAAQAYVVESGWFRTTAASCPALADPVQISNTLTAAHRTTTAALNDGTWIISFPGKEIFRKISGWVYSVRPPNSNIIMDLVKSVGDWQRENDVPTQARDLRAAILNRSP